MEEDASHAEASSAPTLPESAELLLIPSSPTGPVTGTGTGTSTGTLSRLGLRAPGSPTPGAGPGSPADRGQVSAITVVALLDKLVNMLEAVQENQRRMEQRQAELEGAVRVVQGDVSRLSRSHVGTSGGVGKLLERSRKVSGHLKEVKERLDKQGVQVKKLEANHSHLLKRNHFKVLIFQEDNEIPTSVLVKDSLKTPQLSQYDAESTHPTPSVAGSVDCGSVTQEGLHTVSLSSEDDDDLTVHAEEDSMLEGEAGAGSSRTFERRADKFKRSSLKKVDSLKKAFSRQSIEKKMTQITTKIVPPEKRDKLRKSLTPNHPKSPTAKSSTFKVSPMTFNVKKVRDGEGMLSPGDGAHVEIPPLECSEGDVPLEEVHTPESVTVEIQEILSPSSADDVKAELSINGEAESVEINGDRSAQLAVPEGDEDLGVHDEEEEQVVVEEQKRAAPVEAVVDVKQTLAAAAAVAVEQAS